MPGVTLKKQSKQRPGNLENPEAAGGEEAGTGTTMAVAMMTVTTTETVTTTRPLGEGNSQNGS